MRIALVLGLLALPTFAQESQKEDPAARAKAAAERAREALAGIDGVRGVSYAGIEGKYRLFVTLSSDDAYVPACTALGSEFDGIRVVISIVRERPVADEPKPQAPATAPTVEKNPPKEEPPAGPDPKEVERRDALAAKVYEIGVETIKMFELLECDGIRAALGLAAREAGKREKRCELIRQLNWGFRVGATGADVVRHRPECAFDSEQLLNVLPKEIKADLREYATLDRKIRKAGTK